jgi:hypothetical protein
LVVGGNFSRIGGVAAENIAYYKFSTRQWYAIGSGLNNDVNAIAIDGSGNIIAGGAFTDAGGVSNADRIAKWNGSAWSALGSGLGGSVYAIAIDGSGNIIAGGAFTGYVSKWNGASWSILSGVSGEVRAFVIDLSGNIYAGGWWFSGDVVIFVDKWSGASWENLCAPIVGIILSLAIDNVGNIIAGGSFVDYDSISAKSNIMKWDGSEWLEVGGGLNNDAYSLALDSSGNLIVSGDFTDAGGEDTADRIAYFDGTWHPLTNGGGITGLGGIVYAIAVDSNTNSIYAGGDFDTAGTIKCASLACFTRPLSDAIDIIAGLFEQYQARATNTFLPLSGGTITGSLTVNSNAALGSIASYVSGTINDDTAVSFVVRAPSSFGFLLSTTNAGQHIWGRFISSTGAGAIFVSDANSQVVNNTQLTGTTSTDGKLTVSYSVTDGKLYVENRMGANRVVTVQILG